MDDGHVRRSGVSRSLTTKVEETMRLSTAVGMGLDAQLLSGFQRLGLDPSQVKIVLVTHGHADHFGGASYFQEHFGSKVYVSPADWSLMEIRRRAVAAPVDPRVSRHRCRSTTPTSTTATPSRSAICG